MDSRDSFLPIYTLYCCIIAGIGAFSNGWTIGSPNIPGNITHNCPNGNQHIQNNSFPDCLPMTTSLWGFAVASFCLGGLVGGLSGGAIQTSLGRRKTIILSNTGFIFGGVMVGLSINTVMFIIGRLLCGLSCGLGSLVIPTYLGEVSTIKARGILGSFNQFFTVTGILLSSIIGLPTANVPLWRLNYAIVAIPAVFQAIIMGTCVESPRWLVSVDRYDEALEALQKLRGKSVDVYAEFFSILSGQLGYQRAIEIVDLPSKPTLDIKDEEGSISTLELEKAPQNRQPMSIIDIFRDPVIRKITLIVLFHHIIQQLCGMNAVMFYSSVIFETAIDSSSAQYMAIVSSAVNFIMTIFAVVLVDKKGRRLLTLISELGLFLFSLLLVIGYLYNISSLLVASVFLYVASFALGIGPIPWLITSEMTPIYASSAVGAAATSMNWAMSFLVGQLFPVVFDAIQGWSFLIFAVICLSSFFVTWFFLPETKGRSIESIVQGFYKL